jgi:hypothetical protein
VFKTGASDRKFMSVLSLAFFVLPLVDFRCIPDTIPLQNKVLVLLQNGKFNSAIKYSSPTGNDLSTNTETQYWAGNEIFIF